MNDTLLETIQQVSRIELTEERKAILQPLINYIAEKINHKEDVRLNFICTHNSRRSHLSQIWAQTMAFYHGINNVQCYSGGTEATALFPKVAQTLVLQGFQIIPLCTSTNPVYAIKFDENAMPIIGFSKTFDDIFNPTSHFAAIMTCSSADEGCPFIAGAEKRIPVRFEDPKAFDGTTLMDVKYAERSLEIASEMFYVFTQCKL
jgi:arsenate reductase